MLVLSRKVGQTIVLGEGIVVQVVKVQGGRVKLAIQAPASVAIRRGELLPEDDFQTQEFELESGLTQFHEVSCH